MRKLTKLQLLETENAELKAALSGYQDTHREARLDELGNETILFRLHTQELILLEATTKINMILTEANRRNLIQR